VPEFLALAIIATEQITANAALGARFATVDASTVAEEALSVSQFRRSWLSYCAAPHVRVLAVTTLFVACGQDHAITPPVNIIVTPTGTVAQSWVTTADQTRLLSQEPDLAIFTGHDTSTAVITVSASTKYQSMVGFGAAMTDASAYLIETKMTTMQRDVLMQDLFGESGIGLSFVRIPMGASDFSFSQYSYDDVGEGQTDSTLSHFSIAPDSAYKIPALKEALFINPSITFMASPWSPPAWMKSTGSMVWGELYRAYFDSFAEYFARFLEAYQAAGVPIAAITIQNEPHFLVHDYPGMYISDSIRALLIGNHVGPLLAKRAPNVKILDWDQSWQDPSAPLYVLANAQAARYVSGVAWHCYGGDVSAQDTVHDHHSDKETWFTECSGFTSGNWSDDLKWFVGTLIIGSTRAWARSVQTWNLALDENDGPHTGGCVNCRGVVTINSVTGAVTRNVEYFALGHASKFVRPGAYRIASSTDVKGLQTVAFENPANASKALVVLNTTTAGRSFAVHDGAVWFQYRLAAGSVATFVWK
jgi:glucosylceramidase